VVINYVAKACNYVAIFPFLVFFDRFYLNDVLAGLELPDGRSLNRGLIAGGDKLVISPRWVYNQILL
jgi:hypothetical protein